MNSFYIVIIGWIHIAEFRFELLSDITVIPQQYTLHCVTTGYFSYNMKLYIANQPIYDSSVKQLLHSSNNTYDNTVTITWDTKTIVSGSFSQSNNGDQLYRCNVIVLYENVLRADRTRYLTVKGILKSILLI